MAERVGVRELKARLSHYLRKAAAGELIVITQHGKPLAALTPPVSDTGIREMIASGKATWSGKKPTISAPPGSVYPGRSVSDLVLRDRE